MRTNFESLDGSSLRPSVGSEWRKRKQITKKPSTLDSMESIFLKRILILGVNTIIWIKDAYKFGKSNESRAPPSLSHDGMHRSAAVNGGTYSEWVWQSSRLHCGVPVGDGSMASADHLFPPEECSRAIQFCSSVSADRDGVRCAAN